MSTDTPSDFVSGSEPQAPSLPTAPPEFQDAQSMTIHYCDMCRWMLRAAWLSQELLSSFPDELQRVSLQPGRGGVFEVWLGQALVWERKRDGGFPEAKVLKQRVRDLLCPERDLGHSDSRARKDEP